MRYDKRIDGNHKEIREGLRKAGYKVRDQGRLGGGVPDLCVLVKPGLSLHLEVKDPTKPPSATKLTVEEEEWMEFNAWNTRVVFSLHEALQFINDFKKSVWMRLHTE